MKTPLDDSNSDDDSTQQLPVPDIWLETKYNRDKSIQNKINPVALHTTKSSPLAAKFPYQPDLTKHTGELEKIMESAMSDLTDP